MMDASIKACPNDLVEIIGDYIIAFEGLKTQYKNFCGKAIAVDESSAKLMRFNNYVELVVGATKMRAALVDAGRERAFRPACRGSPGPCRRDAVLRAAVLPGLPVHGEWQDSLLQRGEGEELIVDDRHRVYPGAH